MRIENPYNMKVRIENPHQRGIKPEELPPAEDIKKIERKVAAAEKKIEKSSDKLPSKK